MEQMFDKFFDSIANLFGGGDSIPWCDHDVIHGCEKEVAEANKGDSDELKSESIMRLSWALVHSKQPEDVQRGIAMLEASLANTGSPLHQKEKLYLLAVGYYRTAEYSNSRHLVEQCLEIERPPEARAYRRKNITKLRGKVPNHFSASTGITASAVGLIAAGIVAALVRR